jgi:predicted ABC-type ATPase
MKPTSIPHLFIGQKYSKIMDMILHLIFCVLTPYKKLKRVAIRVENGHYVPENEIEKRYNDGYNNLKFFFNYFDL